MLAAAGGHLDCLIYAHSNGCLWDEQTCSMAAGNGHLKVLKYARENGCPWDETVCSKAAQNGMLDCLVFLHTNGCPWDADMPRSAAVSGYLDCLRCAHENGCPWNEVTCSDAAESGNLECLKLYRESIGIDQLIELGSRLASIWLSWKVWTIQCSVYYSIITFDELEINEGVVEKLERTIRILKSVAVSTISPGLPKYLIKTITCRDSFCIVSTMVNFDDELSELCIDLISEQNTPSREDSLSIDIIENGQSNNATSQDLEVIRAYVRKMEEEAGKLKELQSLVDEEISSGPVHPSPNCLETSVGYNLSENEKIESDSRSIYVGNVNYSGSAEELETHFRDCGSVNRVTILCNRYDGHPKGFAYIEFADIDSVKTALTMNNSLFRGRQIKVHQKRTNTPGISTTDRPVPFRSRPMFRDRSMSYVDTQPSFYGGRRSRGGYSRRIQYYPY
ncbi:hypothetical protein QTP88_029296 [Uroleucon formosanum]